MKFILFLLVVYIMGFFTAIPIGATQIEIAKRSLNGHIGSALVVILGSVSSDVMYGFIAFFGVAPFLKDKLVIAIFWVFGAIILLILGIYTLLQSKNTHSLDFNHTMLKSKQLSFIAGFSLAVTNPMMIFWWLLGAQFLEDLNLVTHFNSILYALFLFTGGLGLASYLITLALVIHWAKKFVSDRIMQQLYFVLGFVLVAFSVYFGIRALQVFLN